jgi:hypothetical protein
MKNMYMLLLALVVCIAFAGKAFAQMAANSLPVLLTANANLTADNKIAVTWTILQKVRTDYFAVEKSNDGISWRTIATAKANNDTVVPFTYNTIDPFPLKGSNFYRICLKDMNGNLTFTAIKCVRVYTLGKINIYPNPSSGIVNIVLGQVPGSDWSITLINSTGQEVAQKKYTKSVTVISMPVHIYPTGNYILRISEGNLQQSNTLLIMHH